MGTDSVNNFVYVVQKQQEKHMLRKSHNLRKLHNRRNPEGKDTCLFIFMNLKLLLYFM